MTVTTAHLFSFPFGIPLTTFNPYFITCDSFSVLDSLGES